MKSNQYADVKSLKKYLYADCFEKYFQVNQNNVWTEINHISMFFLSFL